MFSAAPLNEHEMDVPNSGDEKQALRHWLSKLRDLRAEVEKLRSMISSKYAEDMGENLNCAQQWNFTPLLLVCNVGIRVK